MVYFPSQACLLNNSIQQALAKPNLILKAVLCSRKDRKIKINKIPFLLSRNFLSQQEETRYSYGSLIPQRGQWQPVGHTKTTVTMHETSCGYCNTKIQFYLLEKRVKIFQILINEESEDRVSEQCLIKRLRHARHLSLPPEIDSPLNNSDVR